MTDLDPREPEDYPTTIRPSPLPVALQVREVVAAAAAQAAGDEPPNRPSRLSSSLRGKVGKYELKAKLGRGSFGVVFTGRDPALERDVAIKVLRPSHLANLEIVQRFLQEARATARIAHPGIVTIHDCGRVETSAGVTAFIAMELLNGESLTLRLARTVRFEPDAALEIARQVGSALEAAHRANVLHRDLKPDNIYIVPDPAMPEGERIKVLDFGLAKLGDADHTEARTVFGTPRYMSPEQCRSAAMVDHRSDIYALGCILFEMITGRAPFEGDVRQLIERHQRMIAPRASSVIPGLLPEIDHLIADMLAKDPMQRPQTMGAVQRALVHAARGSDEVTSIPRQLPPAASGAVVAVAAAELSARHSAPVMRPSAGQHAAGARFSDVHTSPRSRPSTPHPIAPALRASVPAMQPYTPSVRAGSPSPELAAGVPSVASAIGSGRHRMAPPTPPPPASTQLVEPLAAVPITPPGGQSISLTAQIAPSLLPVQPLPPSLHVRPESTPAAPHRPPAAPMFKPGSTTGELLVPPNVAAALAAAITGKPPSTPANRRAIVALLCLAIVAIGAVIGWFLVM